MKNVYRVLAFLVALGVMVQAAAVAYGFFALGKYIEGGATVDQSTKSFPGDVGLEMHGIGGTIVVPIVVLLFLISSFFAKVPGGIKWALYVLVATVIQVGLGIFSHAVPPLGFLHGIVALVLFGLAGMAGARVSRATAAGPASTRVPTSVA